MNHDKSTSNEVLFLNKKSEQAIIACSDLVETNGLEPSTSCV